MAVTAHGTLTANVVSTVTLDEGYAAFEIVNRDQAGAIWVRFDGTDPVIAAAGTFVVLGARSFSWKRRGTITVKLISDAARAYSVEAA